MRTLHDIVRFVERTALKQPTIKNIVENDIYRLNTLERVKYGVFAWTQDREHYEQGGFRYYNFTFFYVDRLRDDLKNQVEIQSVGIDTLANIMKQIEEDGRLIVGSRFTYKTFNMKFADNCAGVYSRVTLSVPLGNCPEYLFGDFNNDFNDDFFKNIL